MSIETLLSASRARLESPPLVRERPTRRSGGLFSIRITPARAGKTPGAGSYIFPFEDHPRSCGKDYSLGRRWHDFQGSPPLVRERRTTRRLHDCRHGITPARAGKTTISFSSSHFCRNHPRSCGKDYSLYS